ncbi:MAG: phosphatidate cytidylyltransferase [Roseivirga sp.]
MLLPHHQFKQRVLSALVAIPVVILALFWSVWSYFLLFFVIAMFSLLEFYKLVGLVGARPQRLWGTLGGLLIYVLAFMHSSGYFANRPLYGAGPIIALIFLIELYRKEAAPFANIAYTLLGIVYVGMPFALLHSIAFIQGTYSHEPVLGLFLLLWANDTGAYLVGAAIGRRKLFQRISPSKSWEGSIGGAVLTLITSYMMGHYSHSMDWGTWLGIAGIVILAGTYGDLVESMLKRSLQVKDSDQTIPGHGGFLDRFDSFLLSVPFILAYIKVVH